MKPITLSVPGKIHLMGEHAVVYGKPALIAAIDKRCTVTLAPREDKNIQLISDNLQVDTTFTTDEILERTYNAQKDWERFQQTKDQAILKEITKDPLSYLVIAVGETLLFYGKPPIHGFSLHVSSDIPIGAGLGSSAAIAVAVAAAITLFLQEDLDQKKLHDVSLLIEQKKHGNPSGGDPAAVAQGNLMWFRRESDVLKVMQPVPVTMKDAVSSHFYLVDTGTPEESTGEMVQAVRAMYEEKLQYVDQIFSSLEKLTRDMVIVLNNNEEGSLREIIKIGEQNLEKLGVVSDHVKKIIRAIEVSGGAAKISGGGGKTKGTGTLLVYHKDKNALDTTLMPFGLEALSVRLGAPGLTIH